MGKEISETTLNRELQTMRRMMKDAHAEGWISRDPFVNAKVIKMANEKERSRILTANEETRLLAASGGSRQTASKRTGKPIILSVYNEYLRALIILAVDSAMRKSEILQLTWDDIDFDGNSVHVIAANSKTEREREVPLSSRANLELQMLPTFGNGGRVFPFEDFKRSWVTAKQLAEIDDLRFHDLRSTAITRMIDAGLPLPIVAKIAGHSLHTTTVRHYVNLDKDLTRRASDVIDSANKARAKAAIHMTEEFSDAGPILEAMFVN